MCLIAFAIGASARWPLVIASNRDESFDRPALPLSRWKTPEGKEIISGRDVRAGGTWFGITPAGRVAMLTNVRNMHERLQQMASHSRGELALKWLAGTTGATGADQFLAEHDSQSYGPCNLVIGDFHREEWIWASNRAGESADLMRTLNHPGTASGWQSRRLGAGIYGLSNAALDTSWPKTLALKHAMSAALQAPDEPTLVSRLWLALHNRQCASLDELPHTGIAPELELALSSAFVSHADNNYGTRCSTLLLVSTADETENKRADESTDLARHRVLMQEQTHLSQALGTPVEAGQITTQHLRW